MLPVLLLMRAQDGAEVERLEGADAPALTQRTAALAASVTSAAAPVAAAAAPAAAAAAGRSGADVTGRIKYILSSHPVVLFMKVRGGIAISHLLFTTAAGPSECLLLCKFKDRLAWLWSLPELLQQLSLLELHVYPHLPPALPSLPYFLPRPLLPCLPSSPLPPLPPHTPPLPALLCHPCRAPRMRHAAASAGEWWRHCEGCR